MKTIFETLLIVISVSVLSCVRVYADDIKFVLDGNEINYSQIKDETGIVVLPQIIKDRAMVPVRQTAFLLEFELQWDEDTRTMTFTKDEIISTHVLNTTEVTIGGVVKTYDKSSEVVDKKTLMPNIMIADIIGCTTRWDAANRTVIMETKPKGETISPPATAGERPVVLSAISSKPQVMVGEELTVTVRTNNHAGSVNLVTSSGAVIASSSIPTQTEQGRTFILRYTPKNTTFGSLRYKVIAGNESGYNDDAAQTIMLSVIQGTSVKSALAENNKPYLGDKVKLTVVTSNTVANARVTDASANKTYEPINTVTTDSGDKSFTFEVTPEKEGDVSFAIELGAADGSYIKDSKTVVLSVQKERPKESLTVKDFSYDTDKKYAAGDRVKVTVKTSLSAVRVDYRDEQKGEWSSRITDYTDSSDTRTFEITVTLSGNSTNSFTVYAYDDAKNSANKKLQITLSAANRPILKITPLAGNQADWEFEIMTTNNVKEIKVVNSMNLSEINVGAKEYVDDNRVKWMVYASKAEHYVFNVYATCEDGSKDEVLRYMPDEGEYKP